MKYDDAEYYFLEFETDLPNEYGGRHMGWFIEWAILRGLAGDELMAYADAVRSGAMDGLQLLFERCDGKLTDEDLNDEGNAFAEDVYESWFVRKFVSVMGGTPESSADEIFGAEPTAQRRANMRWLLDMRYSDWLRRFGLIDKQTLLDRCLAVVAPVVESAGFPRVEANSWGSNLVCASFERETAQTFRRFDLVAKDCAESFYGFQVSLTAHFEPLRAAIYAEKTHDLGTVTQIQNAAEIPLSRLAEGWRGAIQEYNVSERGFWIFREAEIEPFADWLAARLRTFALPVLRDLDGLDAIALAYGVKPMSASPIYLEDDLYAALLAAEQARHPRLRAMLDEAERSILALEPKERLRAQRGALLLIERIHKRSQWWMH
jgi:hypothetical protein